MYVFLPDTYIKHTNTDLSVGDQVMMAISVSLLLMFTLTGNLTLRQIISPPFLSSHILSSRLVALFRREAEYSPVAYQWCATQSHPYPHMWMSKHTHTHLPKHTCTKRELYVEQQRKRAEETVKERNKHESEETEPQQTEKCRGKKSIRIK